MSAGSNRARAMTARYVFFATALRQKNDPAAFTAGSGKGLISQNGLEPSGRKTALSPNRCKIIGQIGHQTDQNEPIHDELCHEMTFGNECGHSATVTRRPPDTLA
jgi:hypothetical protein